MSLARLAQLLQDSYTLMVESTPPLSVSTAELVTALLRDGVDVRLRLSGWSMKPLVPSGSVVQFSAGARPELGDVVLVRHPNDRLVAHRVVGFDGDTILTKGDSCAVGDGPVPRDRVVGCGVRLEGRKGRWSLPLRTAWMRRLGLTLSFLYPRLVARYRSIVPRERALASDGGGAC